MQCTMRAWALLVLLGVMLSGGQGLASASGSRSKRRPSSRSGSSHQPAKESPGALNRLTVVCSTPGADVFIDGEAIGQAPIDLPVPVTSGSHTIRVTKPGFAPYIDVFKSVSGKPVRIEVELFPISGVLRVRSKLTEARVLVDGKYLGDAPVELELEPGPHRLVVSKRCYQEFEQQVVAVAGEELAVDGDLGELPDAVNPCIAKPQPPPKWYQKRWVWGVIAGSVVAAAGGATGLAVGLGRDFLGSAETVYDFQPAR